jgi:hypothetical protein
MLAEARRKCAAQLRGRPAAHSLGRDHTLEMKPEIRQ